MLASDPGVVLWTVPLAALRAHACPVEAPPWEGASGLLPQMVEHAIAQKDFLETPCPMPAAVQLHARRIAHFAVRGWTDPILVDVGVPWMPGWRPCWPIGDGNHRLYAAILRGDPHIVAEIGGCLETAREWLRPEPTSSKEMACPTT